MRRGTLPVLLIGSASLLFFTCGRSRTHKDPGETPGATPPQGGDGTAAPPPPAAPARGAAAAQWTVRGSWFIPMNAGSTGAAGTGLTAASSTQPISAVVAPSVNFTVNNSAFMPPTAFTGVASFGSLAITNLNDNNLNVCGAGGTQACATAVLRLYTTGTPGAGLWNSTAAYGLPILTGSQTVGLNAANAVILGSVTLTANTHALNLQKFTGGGSLAIPISVDFTNAGAGSYGSTLVVEYALQ